MTRLFDTDGSVTCQLCHNNPNLGWVYHCVQDYDGFLPRTRTSDVDRQPVKRRIQNDTMLDQLSLQTVNAIVQGHYTDDQIGILIEQKEAVRRAVLLQGRHEQTPLSSASSEDTNDIFKFEEDPDHTATTMSTMALDEELQRPRSATARFARSIKERIKDILAAGGVLPRSTSLLLPESQPPPMCRFTVCHKCRPTYRDRAYGSLNHILSSEHQFPPIWELENKPVADVRVVSKLGLSDISRAEGSERALQPTSVHSQSQSTITDSDRGRQLVQHSVRSRSGFRATVRKAIEQAVYNPRTSSGLEDTTGLSNHSSRESSSSRFGRSRLFRRKKMEDVGRARSTVVDGTQLQDALLLSIASNTPLPEASGDTESLIGSEVEVESGLALTEEAGGLSAADVLSQSQEL